MVMTKTDFVHFWQSKYPMKAVDLGEFAAFKVKPMAMQTERWLLSGLGGITRLTAKGLMGLMTMESVVLTPIERDLPLFSWDIIYMPWAVTFLLEYRGFSVSDFAIDYAPQKEILHALENIKDAPLGNYWQDPYNLASIRIRKKGGKSCLPAMKKALQQSLDAYCELAKTAPLLSAAQQQQKQQLVWGYVDELFINGSPTTEVFFKSMSKEKASVFYRQVMFNGGKSVLP